MRLLARVAPPVCLAALALTVGAGSTFAQSSVNPQDLGVVEAPGAGSQAIPLQQLENRFPHILHSAEVALKRYVGGASIIGAQLDRDGLLAIFEVSGVVGSRLVEADIRPDGTVEEVEVEVGQNAVPTEVLQALKMFAPNFSPSSAAPRIEKSIRPSELGLDEIWYEFSGSNFDVEIRSDGKAVLIEPA
jgi:hypothetical protein